MVFWGGRLGGVAGSVVNYVNATLPAWFLRLIFFLPDIFLPPPTMHEVLTFTMQPPN
jgi:hypothetical protein